MNLDEIKPATGVKLVSKSDSSPILSTKQSVRELRIGGAGDVAIRMLDGSEVIIKSCYVGERITGYITHVLSTGTSATEIVAFY